MKVTTTAYSTDERIVKVDGEYAGLITRKPEGWTWSGSREPFRTCAEATQYVAEKFIAR